MHSAWHALMAEQNPAATIESANRIAFANHEPDAASASLCPLTHLSVLRVEGEEAAAFLHNLTSNDVKKLPVGGAHWNSLNSPKGRMLASFLLWRDEAGYGLILAEDIAADISKKLAMYVLRAKVKITNTTGTHVLLGLSGEHAALHIQNAALPMAAEGAYAAANQHVSIVRIPDSTRYFLVLPADQLPATWSKLSHAGAQIMNTNHWIRADVLAGNPLITKLTQDEFVAQMVNFDLLGGVNFKKGCYPGQEIVARTQYLGKLKKRMYRAHDVSAEQPLAGQDLYAPGFGEQSCGKVVTACPAPEGGHDLLVVLQMAAREENAVRLGNSSTPLVFGELPYAID